MYSEFKHVRADVIEATEIRAARVQIVDNHDKVRISMYVTDTGTPVIALHDTAQRDRVYVTEDGDGRGLIILTGDDEGHRASIGLGGDGQPEVRLSDLDGKLRAILYVQDNRPSLIMYDHSESERMSIFLEDNGKPYVMLRNRDGQSQTKLTVSDDGSECFILEDREGEEVRIPLNAPREI